MNSEKPAAIRLSGESILDEHCYFEHKDGKVTLHTLPDAVTVCLSPSSTFAASLMQNL
jgi:kinesin family protein 1